MKNQENIILENFQIEEIEERLEMRSWSLGAGSEQSNKTGTYVYASASYSF